MASKILLVDDSPLITTMLKTILESQKMDVATAANGIDAIMSLYNRPPDLVFLDIMLPDISGYMIARIIKEDPQTKDIPVVLLTGKEDRSSKFWGQEAGADFYMAKEDCKPRELLKVAGQMLKKHPKRQIEPTPPLEAGAILARTCGLLLPRLEELTVHRKFSKLYQLQDKQLLLASLFDLLSYFIDFTSGVFFLTKYNTLYRYTNLPVDPSFFELMTRRFLNKKQTPAIQTLDSFYHLKQCDALNAGSQSEQELQKPELKSYFYHPIYFDQERIAVMMLGSSRENLTDPAVASLIDTIIPLLKTIVVINTCD